MNEKKVKFLGRDFDSLVNLVLCSLFIFARTVAVRLPLPDNVRMDAVNNRYLLKWEWDEMQTGLSTRFTTDYTLSHRQDHTVVCNRTINHQCDFTSRNLSYVACYLIRVRAEGWNGTSNWCELHFCPDEDASLGPPSHVEVVSGDSMLTIVIRDPLTVQNTSMGTLLKLIFRVKYWEAQTPQKVYSHELKQPVATLFPLKPRTTYCLQVSAFSVEFEKTSPFTAEQCVQTHGHTPLWPILILICFFVLLVIAILIWYQKKIKELFSDYNIPTSLQDSLLPSVPILPAPKESCSILDSLEQGSFSQPEEEPQQLNSDGWKYIDRKDSGISSRISSTQTSWEAC